MSGADAVLSGQARWAVLHGDSAILLPSLPRRCVDHVIADPAFSEHVHTRQRRVLRGTSKAAAGGFLDDKGHRVTFQPFGFGHLTPELRRLCGVQFARLAKRWIIVKSDEESRHLWQVDLERGGARHVRCGTWWKIASQPQLSGDRPAVDREALEIAHARRQRMRWNGGGKHASWMTQFPTYRHAIATDRNNLGDRVHTTQTPVALWLDLVEDFTEPGELVLDPFCGSGSLGVACVRLGRRYIGIDISEKCVKDAREWLAAEEQGQSLGSARAGQLSLLGGGQ